MRAVFVRGLLAASLLLMSVALAWGQVQPPAPPGGGGVIVLQQAQPGGATFQVEVRSGSQGVMTLQQVQPGGQAIARMVVSAVPYADPVSALFGYYGYYFPGISGAQRKAIYDAASIGPWGYGGYGGYGFAAPYAGVPFADPFAPYGYYYGDTVKPPRFLGYYQTGPSGDYVPWVYYGYPWYWSYGGYGTQAGWPGAAVIVPAPPRG